MIETVAKDMILAAPLLGVGRIDSCLGKPLDIWQQLSPMGR
jgi:hypothetical protein